MKVHYERHIMITGKQIRAARVLLDWDAEDLAHYAGVNRETIFNIERGTVQARPSTLEKIVRAFNDHRVEFLDDQGVRYRSEDVVVLNGKTGLRRFFDLVFAHVQIAGGVIRQNGIEEKLFDKYGGDVTLFHRTRMAPLVQARKDIFVRAILAAGDMNFVCTNYASYKWHPQTAPDPIPYYLFGETVGIFSFAGDQAPKIVMITSPVISQAYIKQFDQTWEMATLPPIIEGK